MFTVHTNIGISNRVIFSFACGIALAFLFGFILNEKVSHAELNFTEFSPVFGESAGGMIPASCESSPPTNHSGDCPVIVETTIRSAPGNVTASMNRSGTVLVYSPGTQTFNWSSTGATKCAGNWTGQWLPTAGTYPVTFNDDVAYGTGYLFSVRCTDGVFWSPLQSFRFETRYIPVCNSCGA